MIHVYTGKTGSGKTWKMVHDAFKEWKHGRDIYSNIPLFFQEKKHNPNKVGKIFYYEHITELLSVRDGVILMDEAQVLMNARNWENLPQEFQYKLQQHRKHCLDLYATAQNLGTIDITMRRLVQQWYHCYPVFWILHLWEEKDIDQLYNSVDDLKVDTIKSGYYICHPLWNQSIYDTYFDLGFKRFQMIIMRVNGKTKIVICPKNLDLKAVFQLSSTLVKYTSSPKTHKLS